jgi:hypothetical protein
MDIAGILFVVMIAIAIAVLSWLLFIWVALWRGMDGK